MLFWIPFVVNHKKKNKTHRIHRHNTQMHTLRKIKKLDRNRKPLKKMENQKLFAVAKCNSNHDGYIFISEKPLLEQDAIKLAKESAQQDDMNYFVLEFYSSFKRDYVVTEKEISASFLTQKP
jgi:hypothetical protein